MPSYSIIENFEVHKNNRFLEIARGPEAGAFDIKKLRLKGNYGGKTAR